MPDPQSRLRSIVAKVGYDVVRLRADQRGTVAVMMGFLLPILIGGLGIGFEISSWYLQTRAMQNAADSAAIAAASNASSNYDVEAKAVAAQYGFVDGTNNVTVSPSNTAPCPSGGNSCYSVTISSMVPLYVSQVVGYAGDTTVNGVKEKLLSSAAVAQQTAVPQALCLLALSQTGQALRTSGAPNSNFTGCSVMSNSTATCNGSNLQANWGLAHQTNSGCGNKEQSNVPIVPDPYKAMAANIPPYNCGPNPPQESKKGSLPAGNRWSGSLNLSGTKIMCGDVQLTQDVVINTPDNTTGATLVIENGQLDLNGHTLSTANGSAVTIVFSGDNTTGFTHAPTDNSSGQGGVLNIQAPSASTALFQGMAIYQDPSLTTGVDITYKGNNPTWEISGAVYLPNSNVQISGSVSQATNGADCFVMIANTIDINGTSNIYQQSPDGAGCKQAGLNMPTATIPGRSQLVY